MGLLRINSDRRRWCSNLPLQILLRLHAIRIDNKANDEKKISGKREKMQPRKLTRNKKQSNSFIEIYVFSIKKWNNINKHTYKREKKNS